MMRRGSIAALTVGALLAAVIPAQAPVSSAESVVAPQQNKDNSTAPVQGVNVPASMQYMLPRSFGRFFRAQHPIWIGKKKRGNRRNRSRYTYFR